MADDNPYRSPQADDAALTAPMAPRELKLGQLLNDGAALYGKHFVMIALIVVVCTLPVELGKGLVRSVLDIKKENNFNAIDLFVSGVVSAFVAPATIYAVVQADRTGQPVQLGAALKYGLRRWGESFGARFNSGIRIILGCLLLVVPGMIAAARYYLVDEVVALEPAAGKLAIDRSRELTEGHKMTLFLAGIATMLLVIVASAILGAVQGVVLGENPHFAVAAVIATFGAVIAGLNATIGIVAYVSLRFEPGDTAWADSARWTQEAEL